MLAKLLFLISLSTTGFALMCKKCDGYISCSKEMYEECPSPMQCYTIRNQGIATHKGCASNCASVPYAVSAAHCTVCHHRDYCNDEPSLPIGQGAIPDYQNGGGGHHHRHHHIGEGVRVGSSSAPASSFVTGVLALLLAR
uniref:UPAR/Ly6 domain-containing protein n=1 Tax=Haemonchus contortus TaxID=6289 RepID=A0A7I5EAL5_HAECO